MYDAYAKDNGMTKREAQQSLDTTPEQAKPYCPPRGYKNPRLSGEGKIG